MVTVPTYSESISCELALKLLQSSEVVAIPTETVYGLAGRVDSELAIRRIFSTKERPFFDPLIVHVSSTEMARRYSSGWGPICERLANVFWPGPLTIVIEKSNTIMSLISSGLPSVGLRMPDHSVTLRLIENLGVGLAAPSANKFGKTSPTCSDHVLSEFNGLVPVVDGGPCSVGIESTVVQVNELERSIRILRPGAIDRLNLSGVFSGDPSFLSSQIIWKNQTPETSQLASPGLLRHHYAPKLPLFLIAEDRRLDQILEKTKVYSQIEFGSMGGELLLSPQAAQAAREIYSRLRELSAGPFDFLYFRVQDYHFAEEWASVMDRLHRASLNGIDQLL